MKSGYEVGIFLFQKYYFADKITASKSRRIYMYQPLTGIRVVDLSRLLPGPYLTQLLVDLGAEVIKVETPRMGDLARIGPRELGLSGLFQAVNQGKKSVAINYRNPRGRGLFLKLAATADVVLENFRPGSVNRWGIGYEAVKALNPGVVYCSLSGYGQTGPYRDRAGHDLNYASIGGAQALNAPSGGGVPVPYGLPVADLSGAMLGAIAILGALVGRLKTNVGAYLDVALLDGVMSWMAPLAGGAYFNGFPVTGGKMPLGGGQAAYNIYETADKKYVALAAIEPSFWSDFCAISGRPDLFSRQTDPLLKPEIEAIFKQKTRDEWLAAFESVDGCVEPVNSFEEMLEHPHIRARGYIREENDKAFGLNSSFIFARGDMKQPPALGEHTREVLKSVDVSDAEIEELTEKGIIGK
jgi:alpha-methylacyl-CoA racemase